ncbi:hypothetical protein [Desertivirga brevis]|uniref:putative type IX sorting system protein PorV2 n=1 Tax=Desertivirga brevis TaxID=2810310 RepID=UPI001A973582|nr:hypothetical protein [Pedobacter sp. SYSU D00873]
MTFRSKLLLLALLLPAISFAQEKYSNEFLNIGVGSRAFGMSQSVIASANDVTAAYWNPAGLTRMEGPVQASVMHSEYFAGLARYDYAGLATAVSDHTAVVSFSVVRFAVDDIPDTSELIDADGNINYDRVRSFSAADYAFILSYARNARKRRVGPASIGDSENIDGESQGLSYGGNVKVIHRKVGEYGKSFGFGLDFGIQYLRRHWSFGIMGRDITTTYNSWSYNAEKLSTVYASTGNNIPRNSTEITYPRIVLGAAYSTPINNNFGISAETNLNLTTDGKRNVLISADPVSADPTIGIEGNFKKIAFLRAGVGNIQKSKDFEGRDSYQFQPNAGIGIRIKNFSIDYALTDLGNVSDALYSNVFSVRLIFNNPTK